MKILDNIKRTFKKNNKNNFSTLNNFGYMPSTDNRNDVLVPSTITKIIPSLRIAIEIIRSHTSGVKLTLGDEKNDEFIDQLNENKTFLCDDILVHGNAFLHVFKIDGKFQMESISPDDILFSNYKNNAGGTTIDVNSIYRNYYNYNCITNTVFYDNVENSFTLGRRWTIEINKQKFDYDFVLKCYVNRMEPDSYIVCIKDGRFEDPAPRWFGSSTYCLQFLQASKLNMKQLHYGFKGKTIISSDGSINEQEYNGLKQYMSNVDPVAILQNTNLGVHDFQEKTRDMDYEKLIDKCDESIYKAYEIPISMYSKESSTYNNVSESKVALYGDVSVPLVSLIKNSVNELYKYITLSKEDIGVFIEQNDSILNAKMASVGLASKTGVFTINEQRLMGGFKRFETKTADSILVDGNKIKLEDSL